jgi:hypothetical protein
MTANLPVCLESKIVNLISTISMLACTSDFTPAAASAIFSLFLFVPETTHHTNKKLLQQI